MAVPHSVDDGALVVDGEQGGTDSGRAVGETVAIGAGEQQAHRRQWKEGWGTEVVFFAGFDWAGLCRAGRLEMDKNPGGRLGSRQSSFPVLCVCGE